MKRWPQNEEQLATVVVKWLKGEEWEVYQEVQVQDSIADIVAVRGPVMWIIETKLSGGLAVMEQAFGWRGYANYVSIALPVPRGTRSSEFAHRVVREAGLGWLEVSGDPYAVNVVRGVIQPRLDRHTRRKGKVEAVLCEEMKIYSKAGNNSGKRLTPFNQTCRRVLTYVTHHPGATMKEIVDNVPTHYASTAGAKSALNTWIGAGVVPGVRQDHDTWPHLYYAKKTSLDEEELRCGKSK